MNTPRPTASNESGLQATLSSKQLNLLLWLAKDQCARQVAGHSAAPWLSAGHALVRKGLAYTHRTGHFGLEESGKKLAEQINNDLFPKESSTATLTTKEKKVTEDLG